MRDQTPHSYERGPVRQRWLWLPIWLTVILKGHEAWQDRQARRNYEGPQARAERERLERRNEPDVGTWRPR